MIATSPAPDRVTRVVEANRVIQAVSEHGRRFFHGGDNVAHFEVDRRGKVWYVDEYRGTRIYVAYRHEWRGFSNGGTLRDLVKALYRYIRDGVQIRRGHFGPWHKEFCGGDLWGYGLEEMEAVRAKVAATDAVFAVPDYRVPDMPLQACHLERGWLVADRPGQIDLGLNHRGTGGGGKLLDAGVILYLCEQLDDEPYGPFRVHDQGSDDRPWRLEPVRYVPDLAACPVSA